MAHALLGYDGLCKNIHGHTYTLVVTVIGRPLDDGTSPKDGMLIDFKDLKSLIKPNIVDKLDHSLIMHESTPDSLKKELARHYDKVVFTPYQPTTEHMIADLAGQIKSILPVSLELYSLRLRETESSYAEWFASDNA